MDTNNEIEKLIAKKFSISDKEEFELRIKIQKDNFNKCRIKSARIQKGKQLIDILNSNSSFLNKLFLTMVHGKATDNIASMVGKKIIENRFDNSVEISAKEVKLIINKFNELCGTLGVSTHKLLSTAIARFTELNHTGEFKRDLRNLRVSIPLREYALKCGYDVIEHPTFNEEDKEKEIKRAENALKNARKKINKDLSILFSASLSWRETVQGKQNDYIDMRLIEAKGIKNGFINIHFTQSYGEYLVKLPLTQYPTSLLKVDERNNNAYTMGLKFAQHFHMDSNQASGTANLLKVKTLLNFTNLPNINKIRKNDRSWTERIKEPFENSLDILTQCGLLSNWEYCHSKGLTLTDDEAYNFNNFESWGEILIKFEFKESFYQIKKLPNKVDDVAKE